jgi:hypothetical protein
MKKLFLLLPLFGVACQDSYRLDSRDRTIIDTTANNKITELRKTLDDSFKVNREKNVKRLSDSIIDFQLKAIQKQLDFSPKNKQIK